MFMAALFWGISLLYLSMKLYQQYRIKNARRVFLGSIMYAANINELVIDR